MKSTSSDFLRLALGGLVSLLPLACSDAAGGDGGAGAGGVDPGDVDGDGFGADGGDCDDQNRLVHPDADEIALDGLDSDCDGEDLPLPVLVWSATAPAEENLEDALALLDTDRSGDISLAEFGAACSRSAYLTKAGRPGVVQLHASCAGTNSCRGMTYQSWNEVYENTCRGVNACSGWSCVETAEDQGRSGEEAFLAATCDFCHAADHDEVPDPTKFKVPVTNGEDPAEYVVDFWGSRSDDYLRSIIAFGIQGVTAQAAGHEAAYSNMPGAYHVLSRAEMDSLIAHLRTLEAVGETKDPLATPDPIE